MTNPKRPHGRPRLPASEAKDVLSAYVLTSTKAQIGAWQGKITPPIRPTPGVVVERLVKHGKATKFNPAKA